MWLTSSSIGRKFVMALTGICLVLFVTFHCVMNTVAIMWPAAYNQICMFLGANWYALIASAGLAILFIIHIIYASWLTIQNRAARGNDPYKVTSRPAQVEWSSKNMYVLGIVILAFLVVHLIQFWAKMQWMDIIHDHAYVDGVEAPAEFGTLFLQAAFSQVFTPIVYIIGFVALWFHMNHGFWSMFHSIGWDNNKWIERLKCIGCWWTTIVVLLFVAQAVVFTVYAHNDKFLNDSKLQEQYDEYWSERAENTVHELETKMESYMQTQGIPAQYFSYVIPDYLRENPDFYNKEIVPMVKAYEKMCPDGQNQIITYFSKIVNDMEAAQLQAQPTTPANQE